MRVIIAGSRGFNDGQRLYDVMAWLGQHIRIDLIISGGAEGADMLGEQWANTYGVPVEKVRANWGTEGRKAGPIRNRAMAEKGEALVVFWDGKSRGTQNMIKEALAHGLEVHVFRFQP